MNLQISDYISIAAIIISLGSIAVSHNNVKEMNAITLQMKSELAEAKRQTDLIKQRSQTTR